MDRFKDEYKEIFVYIFICYLILSQAGQTSKLDF